MSDPTDGLRAAWSAQTVDVPRFDPSALKGDVERFDRTVRRRNLREYAAGALVVLAFGAVAVLAPDPVGKAGAALIALGAVFVMATLARRGTPTALPGAMAASCLAWRRAELVRERDLLAGVWRWYLGPLVPGLVVFLASGARRADSAGELIVNAVVALVGLAFFGWLGAINARAARELDAELRALPEAPDPR